MRIIEKIQNRILLSEPENNLFTLFLTFIHKISIKSIGINYNSNSIEFYIHFDNSPGVWDRNNRNPFSS